MGLNSPAINIINVPFSREREKKKLYWKCNQSIVLFYFNNKTQCTKTYRKSIKQRFSIYVFTYLKSHLICRIETCVLIHVCCLFVFCCFCFCVCKTFLLLLLLFILAKSLFEVDNLFALMLGFFNWNNTCTCTYKWIISIQCRNALTDCLL